jgi:hypothetical protein
LRLITYIDEELLAIEVVADEVFAAIIGDEPIN